MRRVLAALGVVTFFGGAANALPYGRSDAATCAFASTPVTKDIGGGMKSWVFSEPFRPALFDDTTIAHDAAYTEYTAWLNATIPKLFGGLDPFDQRACLAHQRGIFAGAGFPTHDWDVMLNGTVGKIGSMNCLESLLWGLQNKLHPQTQSPTEFGAYILLGPSPDAAAPQHTIKVYLQTGPTLGVPTMSWVDAGIAKDIKAGFKLRTFLHLHPFDAENIKYQDCAGTCIPSGPDLHAFAYFLKENKCEEAWITNGAASFRFPLSQLGDFSGEMQQMEVFRGPRGLDQN